MNIYYGLGDDTEYPITRWNPLVKRNVSATKLPDGGYEPTVILESPGEKNMVASGWDLYGSY